MTARKHEPLSNTESLWRDQGIQTTSWRTSDHTLVQYWGHSSSPPQNDGTGGTKIFQCQGFDLVP